MEYPLRHTILSMLCPVPYTRTRPATRMRLPVLSGAAARKCPCRHQTSRLGVCRVFWLLSGSPPSVRAMPFRLCGRQTARSPSHGCAWRKPCLCPRCSCPFQRAARFQPCCSAPCRYVPLRSHPPCSDGVSCGYVSACRPSIASAWI